MAKQYSFQAIESKWRNHWEENGIYSAKNPQQTQAQKFYGLVEFPYPSGDGLHVGHPRSYTAMDIFTRKQRMQGKNVIFPMGWDAFGLPTENAAIKKKMQPAKVTEQNIATFKRQVKSLGAGFDWSREVNTTDPAYFKWTQWMFIQFFNSYFDDSLNKARPISDLPIPADVQALGQDTINQYLDSKRMAYKTVSTINWCPSCKIGLANEEAQGGVCERCGTAVEKREKEQWMIRITKYSDRLINDLADVDYLEKIKTQQINWIGRSTGARIKFQIANAKLQIKDASGHNIDNEIPAGSQSLVFGNSSFVIDVFTTRPETLFGATYLVLSPEHELVSNLIKDGIVNNSDEIKNYQDVARNKSDRERQENKEKTGVELKGIKAINPATGKEIPLWIADYVLSGYGTGAIMAVPAHDERDFEFAEKFNLPIIPVVHPPSLDAVASISMFTKGEPEQLAVVSDCYSGQGISINSGFLDGLETSEATQKIITWLKENGHGQAEVNYKQRDWVFSRQRYWGEPIPMVYCDKCGWNPVPETDLPIMLPEVANYEPTDSGESPLSVMTDWVNAPCPACKGSAKRETDTMPNWAGSSWYFLRYCDPNNEQAFASPEALKYWMPVDLYDGGMEHTTLHLLYSRFWYKFLFDLGHIPVSCGVEPYSSRIAHGMILGEGGVKMSKSKGNVINPDEVIAEYGTDVFRCYEMFIGPYDQDAPWSTQGIQGIKRFLDKVWSLRDKITNNNPLRSTSFEGQEEQITKISDEVRSTKYESILHKSIKKIGEDIDARHFNTAVSQLMILTNALLDADSVSNSDFETYLKLLAPFAPHITEEIWYDLDHKTSIHLEPWPDFDPKLLIQDQVAIAVQVNGKVRGTVEVAPDASEEIVRQAALADPNVQRHLAGQEPKKMIYVPGKIFNIVI